MAWRTVARFERIDDSLASAETFANCGITTAARIARITTTMSSSTRVKPVPERRRWVFTTAILPWGLSAPGGFGLEPIRRMASGGELARDDAEPRIEGVRLAEDRGRAVLGLLARRVGR